MMGRRLAGLVALGGFDGRVGTFSMANLLLSLEMSTTGHLG